MVGKALFMPKKFVPARPEVDTLSFKLKSSAGGVDFAYIMGAVQPASEGTEQLHRPRWFLMFSVIS